MRVPSTIALQVCLMGCDPLPPAAQRPAAWITDTTKLPPTAVRSSAIAEPYRAAAASIIAAARADRGAYDKLAVLTDQIGHRLSGTKSLERAIEWAAQQMRSDGHTVRLEPVTVPVWVRGQESVTISATTPIPVIDRPLHVLGLGGTVATPKGGVTAPVIVVHSFDELDARAPEVKGKIVVFDVAMPPYSQKTGSGYGDVVKYRGNGASRAAKHGAVAVLVRSVTAHSLRSPHTGAMRYDPALPKIPAAAISIEDAMWLARLSERAAVTATIKLDAKQLADAQSHNVIGELVGSERPREVVVLGAHIDSWDVGQGAHDDGAGCVTMMQALTVLRRLHLQPRRTIRVVLYTNEENGLAGARQYAKAHADEIPATVLAIEADSGGFAPRGFTVEAKPAVAGRALGVLGQIGSLLAPLEATRVRAGHSGADIGELADRGVPSLGLETDGRTYFDIHHTEADTLDKVDPAALADDVAAVAVMAYVVADLPHRVDE